MIKMYEGLEGEEVILHAGGRTYVGTLYIQDAYLLLTKAYCVDELLEIVNFLNAARNPIGYSKSINSLLKSTGAKNLLNSTNIRREFRIPLEKIVAVSLGRITKPET